MRTMFLVMVLVGCSGGAEDTGDEGTCDIPSSCTFSTANTGGACQVNLYCANDEPAAYCFEEDDGTYTCDCGAAADDPPSFTSDDICDLEMEAAVCAAMAECGNWTYD